VCGCWPLLGRAEGLLEVYDLAKNNDPDIQAARAALSLATARVPEARAALLPQLSATGSNEHDHEDTVFSGSPPEIRKFRQYTWNVQLTQPLIQFDALFGYREASALAEQAQAQYLESTQDLILRTAQAYFDVLLATDAVDAARRQEAAASEQLAVADKGFRTGTQAVTDAYEARAKAASAKSQRIAAQNDLSKARVELEKITGVPVGELWPLRPDAALPAVIPASVAPWAERAGSASPTVLAGKAAVAAANEDVRKSRSDHLPTLGVVASYGGNYSGASTTTPFDYSSFSKGTQAGLQLSVPLYSGGGIDAKVSEAIASREKAEAELEGARRKAIADAKEAFSAVESGLAQVEALNVALESGEKAVTGNERGYRLGIRINSDVLTAQQDLYATRRDLSKARIGTIIEGLKLKAAAGSLSEADLFALDRLMHARPVDDQSDRDDSSPASRTQ
jgi:outer membrane protein